MDAAFVGLNQASVRLFVVPSSLGVEQRVLNGYVYISANSVTDEATLAQRSELFAKRGGYYYEHWDELYARWQNKVDAATRELEALEVPELPEFEDEAVVTEGRGWGSSVALLVAYDRLLEGLDRVLQYHFELLNLGYGAYLLFYDLCRQTFPGIAEQTMARMVSGIDVALWRPDDELRRLARLALELEVDTAVKAAEGEDELRAGLADSEAGARWLADFDRTKNPWFYFSYGNGLYHHHRSWIDDTALPIAMIGSYIERLVAGEDISRPYEAVIFERDRITMQVTSGRFTPTSSISAHRKARRRPHSRCWSRSTTRSSIPTPCRMAQSPTTAIRSNSYGTVMSWNTKTYGEIPPKTWAEFWDVAKFPGRRALRANAQDSDRDRAALRWRGAGGRLSRAQHAGGFGARYQAA